MQRKGFLGSVLKLARPSDSTNLKPFAPFIDISKIAACASCENAKCVSSCSKGVIIVENASPVLDFSNGGCDLCKECLNSCEFDVFSVEENAKIDAVISLDPYLCVAYRGTICRSCFDPCDEKAIRFLGLFYPEIDPQKCTACGFCIKVCPSFAITASRKIS